MRPMNKLRNESEIFFKNIKTFEKKNRRKSMDKR